MNNHVHLIVESEDGNKLSGFMKRLNVYYVNYYRKKYRGIGHFFQDRFKSFLIQRGRYMLECGRYVELNAVKAGAYRFSECLGQRRLAGAGKIFKQHVAAGGESGHEFPDSPPLPAHHLPDIRLYLLKDPGRRMLFSHVSSLSSRKKHLFREQKPTPPKAKSTSRLWL